MTIGPADIDVGPGHDVLEDGQVLPVQALEFVQDDQRAFRELDGGVLAVGMEHGRPHIVGQLLRQQKFHPAGLANSLCANKHDDGVVDHRIHDKAHGISHEPLGETKQPVCIVSGPDCSGELSDIVCQAIPYLQAFEVIPEWMDRGAEVTVDDRMQTALGHFLLVVKEQAVDGILVVIFHALKRMAFPLAFKFKHPGHQVAPKHIKGGQDGLDLFDVELLLATLGVKLGWVGSGIGWIGRFIVGRWLLWIFQRVSFRDCLRWIIMGNGWLYNVLVCRILNGFRRFGLFPGNGSITGPVITVGAPDALLHLVFIVVVIPPDQHQGHVFGHPDLVQPPGQSKHELVALSFDEDVVAFGLLDALEVERCGLVLGRTPLLGVHLWVSFFFWLNLLHLPIHQHRLHRNRYWPGLSGSLQRPVDRCMGIIIQIGVVGHKAKPCDVLARAIDGHTGEFFIILHQTVERAEVFFDAGADLDQHLQPEARWTDETGHGVFAADDDFAQDGDLLVGQLVDVQHHDAGVVDQVLHFAAVQELSAEGDGFEGLLQVVVALFVALFEQLPQAGDHVGIGAVFEVFE